MGRNSETSLSTNLDQLGKVRRSCLEVATAIPVLQVMDVMNAADRPRSMHRQRHRSLSLCNPSLLWLLLVQTGRTEELRAATAAHLIPSEGTLAALVLTPPSFSFLALAPHDEDDFITTHKAANPRTFPLGLLGFHASKEPMTCHA